MEAAEPSTSIKVLELGGHETVFSRAGLSAQEVQPASLDDISMDDEDNQEAVASGRNLSKVKDTTTGVPIDFGTSSIFRLGYGRLCAVRRRRQGQRSRTGTKHWTGYSVSRISTRMFISRRHPKGLGRFLGRVRMSLGQGMRHFCSFWLSTVLLFA